MGIHCNPGQFCSDKKMNSASFPNTVAIVTIDLHLACLKDNQNYLDPSFSQEFPCNVQLRIPMQCSTLSIGMEVFGCILSLAV